MERRLWTAWLLGAEQEEEGVGSLAPCWRAGGGDYGQPGSFLESRWRRAAGGGRGSPLTRTPVGSPGTIPGLHFYVYGFIHL